MENIKKFFTDVVLKTGLKIHYGIRDMLKQMGILEQLELGLIKNVESPLLTQWFKSSYDCEFFNAEEIPPREEGPVIVAANHQSIIDPLTTGLAVEHYRKRMPRILTKIELRDDPFLGAFVTFNQVIYIKRGEKDYEALQKCVDTLVNDNKIVMIYPEGTYGPGGGKFLEFKSGIARVAWDAQVDVVPLANYGDDVILPKSDFKNFQKKGPKLAQAFGKRIPLTELFPGKKKGDTLDQTDYQKATELIQTRVKQTWDMLDRQFNNYDTYQTYYQLHPDRE